MAPILAQARGAFARQGPAGGYSVEAMGEKTTKGGLAAASVALAAAAALAGCGDTDSHGDDSASAGYGEPSTPEGASPTATVDADDPHGTTDEIGLFHTELGKVIADDDDRTLYMSTEDSGGTSACYGECAEGWPPVLAEGDDVEVDDDLDPAPLGTIERDDGSTQVTYNGHPLYYWAEDIAPGDVDGQGADDSWYVLDAEGNPVTGAPGR